MAYIYGRYEGEDVDGAHQFILYGEVVGAHKEALSSLAFMQRNGAGGRRMGDESACVKEDKYYVPRGVIGKCSRYRRNAGPLVARGTIKTCRQVMY